MPGIEQVADFCLYGDQVHLLYKKESELNIRTIVLSDNVTTDETVRIQTSEAGDIIRSEKESEGGVRRLDRQRIFRMGLSDNPKCNERRKGSRCFLH